jgi:Na+/H+ antiporter NhaC
MIQAAASALRQSAERTHDRGGATVEVATGRETLSARERTRRHGIGAQFSMMIRGAVLLAVGVFITSAIFSAIPDSNTLGGAQTQVEDLTGQAFEIAPVVLIVIVAVLILTFVRDL